MVKCAYAHYSVICNLHQLKSDSTCLHCRKIAPKLLGVTSLDVPSVIVNDRTMVPIRFIAESFGADVFLEETELAVVINT